MTSYFNKWSRRVQNELKTEGNTLKRILSVIIQIGKQQYISELIIFLN